VTLQVAVAPHKVSSYGTRQFPLLAPVAISYAYRRRNLSQLAQVMEKWLNFGHFSHNLQ
jgi:hypothetical protein